ncbi:MAG: hypothetical protein KDE59_26365 [Anaerolineales bacterium]|nr:hypothetical protein [Anaerolineales bacterium]
MTKAARKHFLLLLCLPISLLLFNVACAGVTASDKEAVIENYADIVLANYEDALTTATALDRALHDFVAVPSPETLQAARASWLAAREPYGQTEAFRFAGGPIDDEDGPEGLLNGWPLDEGYIDYVAGAPASGIINDVANYPEITPALLASLNEVGAEENISSGYHAIEFLLWGQDQSDDGSGDRPFTDYTTAANADRRGQYLLAASELLLTNLQSLVEEWETGADNYRAEFLAQEPDIALQQILTGIGVLSQSELAGERIFVAYDNQDQEDEHSCFSDNTHRDIILNAQGIHNVYFGSYTRVDGTVVSGPSLADLVAATDSELAEEMASLAEEALAGTKAIHVPFDRAIVETPYRDAVIESVFLLQDQGEKFITVSAALGLEINTDLPE